jgi:hypothetical protein
MRARECRGTGRPPGHKYGLDGHVRTDQQMARKIITKNAFILCFFLLTRTHRSMQVVNGRLIWKCGRGVTGEVTLQIPTICVVRWQKLDCWVIDKFLLHFHYYRCCHVYNLFLLAGKVKGRSGQKIQWRLQLREGAHWQSGRLWQRRQKSTRKVRLMHCFL